MHGEDLHAIPLHPHLARRETTVMGASKPKIIKKRCKG